MKTVYKYDIPFGDEPVIEMPEGARVLSVAQQGPNPDNLVLWAIVDPNAPLEKRKFTLRGTGHPLPDKASWDTFIGTIQAEPYVWHLFENNP